MDKDVKDLKKKDSADSFTVVSATFVRAGAWDTPLSATDSHAKEILLVAEKG